jgi:hypothetical protein
VTLLQVIFMELVGANGVQVLKDAPAPSAGAVHSVANSILYLHAMMDSDIKLVYTKLTYGVSTDSNLSEEECKPCGHNCKKSQHSKLHGGHEKKKKDKDDKPIKNTCPHCKKFHHRKLHRINPDKCMWNKKYKDYRFKSKCNEIKVAFKPLHIFLAELGGYAEKEDSGSILQCMGLEDDRRDGGNRWTLITWKDISCNKNLTLPVLATVKNVFIILSVSTDPTTNTNAPTLASSPITLGKDDKTITPPSPQEHRRQQNIAWRHHIKQTIQWLCKSDDLNPQQ